MSLRRVKHGSLKLPSQILPRTRTCCFYVPLMQQVTDGHFQSWVMKVDVWVFSAQSKSPPSSLFQSKAFESLHNSLNNLAGNWQSGYSAMAWTSPRSLTDCPNVVVAATSKYPGGAGGRGGRIRKATRALCGHFRFPGLSPGNCLLLGCHLWTLKHFVHCTITNFQRRGRQKRLEWF